MIDPSSFSVEGKRALVTGGAAGIGAAIAEALAACGADVAVTAHTRGADEVLAAIGKLGRKGEALSVDLANASKDEIAQLIAHVEGRFGGLDILVNNAGIIRRADALDFTETDWDEVMDLNLKTAFFLSQAAARQMLAADYGGRIINIASMLSFQGGIRIASYTASKSGIAGLTRLLANEWAARGINVNAIAPGYFVTDNTSALRADPVRSREILARIPAGRWGEPRELAGAAVFLAGPASDYVHGAIIPVDGGWLAR
jgi:2-deoxy-D-gluconate 3-dehydrogenase